MYLTPDSSRLFKIKSDIVFCVLCTGLFLPRPCGGGGGVEVAASRWRRPVRRLGEAGPAGRKLRPGSDARRAMAAAGWRWPARLLVALRDLPVHRSLHDATPPRDVLLFKHERGRFFTVLGLFCAGQGVFWASLAVAALTRPPAPARAPDADLPGRGRLDVRSVLWRYGLAVGCGAIGKAWAGFPPQVRGWLGTTLPA